MSLVDATGLLSGNSDDFRDPAESPKGAPT